MIGRTETGDLNRAAQRRLTPEKCLELHLSAEPNLSRRSMRRIKAGHMTASDPTHDQIPSLQAGGRPHM